MDKTLTGICCGLAILAIGLGPGAARGEPSVGDIYFARYSVVLPPPLADDGYFFHLSEPALISVEALYASASSSLGWYAHDTQYILMDPLSVGMTVEFWTESGAFGLWLITHYGEDYECFSDPLLNGGVERLRVYGTPLPEQYFLAWEDCASVDGDFNDVVLIGSHFALTSVLDLDWGVVKSYYR